MEDKKNYYQLKGEMISDAPAGYDINPDLSDGVDCDGFVMAAFSGGTCNSYIVHLNVVQLAAWIAANQKMMRAARLAIALGMDNGESSGMKSIEQLFGLAE